MNTMSSLSLAAILSFFILASAQDTVNPVPGNEQWFADSISNADAASRAKNDAVSRADAVFLADSSRPYTIVVTATRREQPSEWVSDDHEVIDIDEIRRRSSKSISEILASNISARFSDNGGGTVKTISLRGAGSERTLILVDGKRMGTTDGDLGDLVPENIEKIEVIEGGQSAQYGMDAVGGVVNIITKQHTSGQWSRNFSATAASYEPDNNQPRLNTQAYAFSVGKKIGPIESFTAADYSLSDGRYDYTESGQTFSRGYNDCRGWGLFQKLGYTRGDIALGAVMSFRDRRIDNAGPIVYPDSGTTKKNIGYVALNGDWRASEVLRLKANGSVAIDNIRFEPVSVWYSTSNHAHLNGDIELVQEFTFGKQLLTTGIQGMRQSVSSSEIGDRLAGQGSAFASAVLSRSVADVTVRAMPAVRVDYSSVFKSALNGRFGLMATWKQALSPSFFANIGNSYRSPTFNDRYWPRDFYSIGNPDLKQESSFDVDGGVQIRGGNRNAAFSNRITVFQMHLNDMIIWAPRSDGLWSPQNVTAASIGGFKFNSQLHCSNIYDIAFDFIYTNARNDSTDKVLIYRPRHNAMFSNQLSIHRFTAGFSLRYSSEEFADDANMRRLPAAVTADVNLGITLMRLGSDNNGLRLVYDILNVTNEDRMVAEGYPLPKREHRLGLKVGF